MLSLRHRRFTLARLSSTSTADRDRRGAIIVLSAFLMIVVFGLAAFAIDIGYMMLVRTQLQAAADAGAMAAGNSMYGTPNEIIQVGKNYVQYHDAGGRKIAADEALVELGNWNAANNTFTPTADIGNAVRVTASRANESFFFASVLGSNAFAMEASAVAMANPRDIAFVVDLSGSMNDDTEPAWATDAIYDRFEPLDMEEIAEELMEDLYVDLGFGSFPGTLEYLGAPAGVAPDEYAYAELTKDSGPLTGSALPGQYRILTTDDEATRKVKAYRWIIDAQIANVMPAVSPAPTTANYAYWEKYLDYIIDPTYVHSTPYNSGGGSWPSGPTGPQPPIGFYRESLRNLGMVAALLDCRFGANALALSMATPGAPPVDRGWLPAGQDDDRIHNFNNPNWQTFPAADGNVPYSYRNKIGYLTYVQFLMDHGRNLKPEGATNAPHSIESPHCPYHQESTPAGSFSFPPREQPMHACRRALIAANDVIEDRNTAVPDVALRDQVAIITFDSLDNGSAPEVAQPLTGIYQDAMLACTELQAVGDKGTTTATQAGLALAAAHLKPTSQGGFGRKGADKVVVLLTDGVPNAYSSSNSEVDSYTAANPDSDYYGGGYYWLDAALAETAKLKANGVDVYPVGIGLGADYNFMDRVARMGGTANAAGQGPRGSGNPAEYEQVLSAIFEKIVASPTARLVE